MNDDKTQMHQSLESAENLKQSFFTAKVLACSAVLISGLLVGAYFVPSSATSLPDKSQAWLPTKKYLKPEISLNQAPKQTEKFMRVVKNASGEPESVEVAVATYKPIDGSELSVDLVGAIHLGEKSYFKQVNDELKSYDSVLFELVAPKDTRPNQGPSKIGGDPLQAIQGMLPLMVGLTHQIEAVDYHAANFVHADLSFDQLIAEGRRRGETTSSFFGGLLLDFIKMNEKVKKNQANASAKPAKQANVQDLLTLLRDPLQAKREFAKTLAQMEGADGMMGFSTLNPYIVDVRNDAALKVLDQTIENGKTNIAIYYGAAHLKDFEKKLYQDYGLEKTNIRWVKAWDLTENREPGKNGMLAIMKLLQNL